MKIIGKKGILLIKIGKNEKNFVKKIEIVERMLKNYFVIIETKNEFIVKTRNK